MSTKRKRSSRSQEEAETTDQPSGDVATAAVPGLAISDRILPEPNDTVESHSHVVKRIADDITTPRAKRTLPSHVSKQSPRTPKHLTTPRRNAADRSAKRKSSRRILEETIADDSEDEGTIHKNIAEEIIGGGVGQGEGLHDAGDVEDNEENDEPGDSTDELPRPDDGSPVKRGRGRPKGSKNREITPPTELPAHEWYFWINRPNGSKTSTNTFPSSALLSHSAYHEAIRNYKDPHKESIQNLHEHHSGQFPLWAFELEMGFSVLLYGYGDKLPLMQEWADWLHAREQLYPAAITNDTEILHQSKKKGKKSSGGARTHAPPENKTKPIVIVLDGHHPALTPHSLFTTIAEASLPDHLASSLPRQLPDACAHILSSLTSTTAPSSSHIYLLISPIHAPLLTHAPMPALLASLASHPRIHLLAAADDAQAALLWPQALKDAYNWVFHDGTTFVPYDDGGATGSVAGAGVVDTVNELLGRKGARGKGREGVRWVLRSLPENARGVYRILVAEILSADGDAEIGLGPEFAGLGPGGFSDMDLDIDFGLNDVFPEDDDEDMVLGEDGGGRANAAADRAAKAGRKKGLGLGLGQRKDELPAVLYKLLYAKAVEEFLCSSEMAFRGLLKEFVDHQMVVIKRDIAGQEALTIEMRKDELEGVLEDLTLGE